MLGLMRKNANSWVIGLLFTIIIFVFALNFGPWAGNVGGGPPYAADVNGRVITLAEFQIAYTQQLRSIQSYRPEYSQAEADKDGMKQFVLDQLVAKELLSNLAQKNGLFISDAELASFIKRNLFGSDVPYSKEIYHRIVYSNFNSTESQFETQVRRELLAERMANLLRTGVQVNDNEVLQAFEAKSAMVALDFLRVDPQQMTVANVMTDIQAAEWAKDHKEEVTHYYNQHLSEFRTTPTKDTDLPVHKELKEVENQIAILIAVENAKKTAAEKLAEKMIAELKSGSSLVKVKNSLLKDKKAVNVDSTGLFREDARYIPKIGLDASLVASAFQLTAANPVSSKVFALNDAFYVIKLKAKENPDMKKYAAQKESIRSNLLMLKEKQLMQNYITFLKDKASIKYNHQLVPQTSTT